tara:strand:+ start:126 stop:1331 length:1206 start_codon:yes stop_codon:yes gene_type:complete
MTDDKNLVDAYASIYKKKESEEISEIAVTGTLAAMKGIGMAAKLAKGAKIASKVGTIAQGVGAVRDAAAPRGKGQMNPQQNEEVVNEALPAVAAGMAVKNTAKAVGGAAKSVGGAVKDVAMQAAKKAPVTKTTTINASRKPNGKMVEDVAITHLDGSTTEVVDVVKSEPLGNPDEKLASRLWDQIAANLDTLGEMYGATYDVVELDEKKKLDKVGEEDEDVDNDGDVDDSDSYIKNKRDAIGKAMGEKKGKKKDKDMKEEAEQIDEVDCWDTHKKVGMKKKGNKMVNDCRPKNESFNVKSPVTFSKPSEEVVEETISSEQFEKHASYTTYAHRKIAWDTFDMTENREYSHNPEKYHDSEGNPKDMEMDKPYRKRSKAARMKDPERGINSPAFKKFMADRGM